MIYNSGHRKKLFTLIALLLILTTNAFTRYLDSKNIKSSLTSKHVLDARSNSSTETGVVERVVDGDTIIVSLNGKKETVRIIGINTPETVDPRRRVECFGKEASNRTKELLLGKNVTLESDPSQQNRDRYNRLLRYVWIDNKTIDVGKLLLKNGFAYEYTYNSPYMYQSIYRKAQEEAKNSKLGLWADNACN